MPDVHEKVDALPALIAPRAISDIKVISRTGHTLKVSAYQYTWPTVGALRLQPTALLDSAVWVDKLVAEVVEQHRLDVTELCGAFRCVHLVQGGCHVHAKYAASDKHPGINCEHPEPNKKILQFQ